MNRPQRARTWQLIRAELPTARVNLAFIRDEPPTARVNLAVGLGGTAHIAREPGSSSGMNCPQRV